MSYQIEFATASDEEGLRRIFLASDMAVVGDAADHVVIKDSAGVCGGGLLYQLDEDLFHLLTIVVQGDGRSRGIGSRLLQAMLQDPWGHCRDAVGERGKQYSVTTVSRGSSRKFYQKNGMIDCTFRELVEPFDRQCEACPELVSCGSAAMVYKGQGKGSEKE